MKMPPLVAPPTQPSWPDNLRQQALEYTRHWIVERQGSPAELIAGLEELMGWPARHILPGVLEALRAKKDLPAADRKFLIYTLSEGAVGAALAGDAGPNAAHQSSLDDLFARSRRYRRSHKFAEAVDFISKFRDYSPFNNMLVYLQNPLATYFATASHWHKAFRRSIKDEARGLVILAPRTPVLMVYDIADTDGPPLPDKMEAFTQTTGPFNPIILDRTLKTRSATASSSNARTWGRCAGASPRRGRRRRPGKCASACVRNWSRPRPTRCSAMNWPTSIWVIWARTRTAVAISSESALRRDGDRSRSGVPHCLPPHRLAHPLRGIPFQFCGGGRRLGIHQPGFGQPRRRAPRGDGPPPPPSAQGACRGVSGRQRQKAKTLNLCQ